jgi:hypothetical protein
MEVGNQMIPRAGVDSGSSEAIDSNLAPLSLQPLSGTQPDISNSLRSLDSLSSSKAEIKQTEGPRKKPSFLNDIRGKKKFRNEGSNLAACFVRDKVLLANFESLPLISADDLKDKDWKTERTRERIPRVEAECESSAKDSKAVKDDHGKKHQINWLAEDARHREDLLLERSSAGKKQKRSTAMKYGW